MVLPELCFVIRALEKYMLKLFRQRFVRYVITNVFNSRFNVLEYFNGCPTNKIAVLHSCLLAPAFISGKIKSKLSGLNFTPSFSK